MLTASVVCILHSTSLRSIFQKATNKIEVCLSQNAIWLVSLVEMFITINIIFMEEINFRQSSLSAKLKVSHGQASYCRFPKNVHFGLEKIL